MFRAAKIGIAVSNACDDAKAAADLTTVSNEEHAIAQVIRDLENGKYSFWVLRLKLSWIWQMILDKQCEGRKIIHKLNAHQTELEDIAERALFAYAFKMGMRIAIETLCDEK